MMTRSSTMSALLIAVCLCGSIIESVNAQDRTAPRGPVRLASNNRVPGRNVALRSPFGELTKEHQEYLDKVLEYWEHSSGQIERYRCSFTRWQYDPVFGPGPDPKTGVMPAKTISTGAVKYATPDKGMYDVEKIYHYTAPKQPGGEPQYVIKDKEEHEKWICDGSWIYEFDYPRKKLVERELPPQMRGKSISEGPLPFLFGAKKVDVKNRYWIRVITPRGRQGEYWLEAYPKFPADATSYKKVEIIIDEKDFLPKGIQIFDVNYDARRNPARTAFTFEKRQVNWFDATENKLLGLFLRAFHKPKLPSGWERVVMKFQQTPPATPGASVNTTRVPVNSRLQR